MGLNKKKISELPEAESLEGFKTIGVNSDNESVQADLSFIATAADEATNAAAGANEAASKANAAANESKTFLQELNEQVPQYIELVESTAENANNAAAAANIAAENAQNSMVNYDHLQNRPQINGVVIEGNKSLEDYGLVDNTIFTDVRTTIPVSYNATRQYVTCSNYDGNILIYMYDIPAKNTSLILIIKAGVRTTDTEVMLPDYSVETADGIFRFVNQIGEASLPLAVGGSIELNFLVQETQEISNNKKVFEIYILGV